MNVIPGSCVLREVEDGKGWGMKEWREWSRKGTRRPDWKDGEGGERGDSGYEREQGGKDANSDEKETGEAREVNRKGA